MNNLSDLPSTPLDPSVLFPKPPPTNPFANFNTETVYVVLEILDPNICFASGQSKYIKYDEKKCLSVIGVYENIREAEIQCKQSVSRHIVTSSLYKNQLPPLFRQDANVQPTRFQFNRTDPCPLRNPNPFPNPFPNAQPRTFIPTPYVPNSSDKSMDNAPMDLL